MLTSYFMFLFKMFICDRFKSVGTAAQVNIFSNITNFGKYTHLNQMWSDIYQLLTVLFWIQNNCPDHRPKSGTAVWFLVSESCTLSFHHPTQTAPCEHINAVSSSQINVISEHNPGGNFISLLNVFTIANELDINVIPGRQSWKHFLSKS